MFLLGGREGIKNRKLSSIDVVLVTVLMLTAVSAISVFRLKTGAEDERVRLETRARTAEQNVAAAEKEADLDGLNKALENARLALGENPFPGEAKAQALVDELARLAQMNGVIIVSWNNSYASATLKTRRYLVMNHSLTLEGKPDALGSFIAAVTHTPAAPIVQNMNMSVLTAKDDSWRMGLDLVIYFHN